VFARGSPGVKVVRCAIYTRVSTDQGLEQDFNSLDAQYDASQAYVRSQAHAGWSLLVLSLHSFACATAATLENSALAAERIAYCRGDRFNPG
jgi:hypothetical protein